MKTFSERHTWHSFYQRNTRLSNQITFCLTMKFHVITDFFNLSPPYTMSNINPPRCVSITLDYINRYIIFKLLSPKLKLMVQNLTIYKMHILISLKFEFEKTLIQCIALTEGNNWDSYCSWKYRNCLPLRLGTG